MDSIDRIINRVAINKKNHFWVFFAILLLLTSIMMYLYSPLYPGHDLHFHFVRIQALMTALTDGSFYPSYIDYASANGYGYFTKAFYSDVILIPFAIIGCFTSVLVAYQTLIFTITVLCGIFTYKTVNYILQNHIAALISALLYTFCFYRLLDLYFRAALGEVISFTFVPLVFLGLYHIIKGDYKKWYILSIGFGLMIFTHVISSVLMFLTILVFLLIYNKRLRHEPQRIGYLVFAGFVTLLITAYYLYPMLEQMLSNSFYYKTRNITEPVEAGAKELHWIIWGMFTGIVHTKQIFVPGIGVLLTMFIFLRLFIYEKNKELKLVDTLLIVGFVYVFAVSTFFPWGYFPFKLLNFIQLPWRLYEFSSFFFAVAGGYFVALLLKTNKRQLIGVSSIVLLLIVMLSSDSTLYKESRSFQSLYVTPVLANRYHLGGLEYFPDKLPSLEFIEERGDIVIADRADITVENLTKAKGITQFDVRVNDMTTLELPLVYYKGYQAKTSSGEYLPISESENGLVQVEIAKSDKVNVYYGGTLVQKISWFISLLSLLALCVYIFINRRNNKINSLKA